jgi:TRAP-type mannitol/chloroaromatic compound transport system permease small subunit
MRYFHKGIRLINEWFARIFHYVVLLIAAIMLTEVIARYVFNEPTLWGPETSEMLFGFIIFMAGGYVLLKGEHIRVDVLYRRFSARVRAILDSLTSLLFFTFVAAYLRVGITSAWKGWLIRETSGSVWDPPFWPFKWILVLGFILLLLQGISNFAQHLSYAIRGKGELPL